MALPPSSYSLLSKLSLRRRYLLTTALLTTFIVITIAFSQGYVSRQGEIHRQNTELRNNAVYQTRLLSNSIQEVEKNLEAYLLEPEQRLRNGVYNALESSHQQYTTLIQHDWYQQHPLHQAVAQNIGNGLSQLHMDLSRLMDLRISQDNMQLYKTVQGNYFIPNEQLIDTAIQDLRNSLQQAGSNNIQSKQIQTLESLWYDLHTDLHRYTDKLNGLLDEPQQRDYPHLLNIEYQRLQSHIQTTLDEQKGWSATQLVALSALSESVEQWFQGIEQLNSQGNSGTQPQHDAPFMKHVVEPQFTRLWDTINQLEIFLEKSAQQDVSELTAVAERIAAILWILALIGLTFAVIGYVYFERIILRPIAMMTNALYKQAHNQEDIELPVVHSQETRLLVDAFTDMRREIKDRQSALEHLALHDTLTNLPNRTLFNDRLEQSIVHASKEQENLALIIVDLDRFKEINNTLGIHTGDSILVQFCSRFSKLLRPIDTMARLGGDEFALLLPDMSPDEINNLTRLLKQSLEVPFLVETHNLYLGCSMGIALFPEHASEATSMTKKADLALNAAKMQKSGIEYYHDSHQGVKGRSLSLANDLHDSINKKHFHVVFQPQLQLNNNQYIGAEALLRWQHPKKGLVSPDEFIPIAEQTGLIRPLTYCMIAEVLQQMSCWLDEGVDCGVIAINLSVFNLQDPVFPEELERLLHQYDIPANRLMLEITESAMMADPARALNILERLHHMDLMLAIDDFGTGFSSLAYLKQLPVSKLKIDKSFVMEMTTDDNDAIIVHSTIDLAHHLGLKVVAEGVENEEVMGLLAILQCDFVQGYHIHAPMPLADFNQWLALNGQPSTATG